MWRSPDSGIHSILHRPRRAACYNPRSDTAERLGMKKQKSNECFKMQISTAFQTATFRMAFSPNPLTKSDRFLDCLTTSNKISNILMKSCFKKNLLFFFPPQNKYSNWKQCLQGVCIIQENTPSPK